MYSNLYAPIPDVDRYLKRIGMPRPAALTKEYLDELIYAHQCEIPYDTLDVGLLGKDVSLGIEDLYNKIVVNNRGGYCFELNGFFIKLVQELGYDAYSVPCRIMRSVDAITPVFHKGSCVRLDGKKYFFDVGCSVMPPGLVEYKEDVWQENHGLKYMMERVSEYFFNLFRLSEDSQINAEKTIALQVGIAEYAPVDFVAPNAMCGVGENAAFRKNRRVTKRTPTGSVTLADKELAVIHNHEKTITMIETEEEYFDTLKKVFGIDLKEEYEYARENNKLFYNMF